MLKDITLGQYFPGDTLAHRLDPRTKLLATVLYIIAIFLAKGPIAYGVLILTLIVSVRISRVGARALFRGLKPVLFIIAFTAVLNLFYTPGTVIAQFWIFHVTREGVITAIAMMLRISLLIMGTFLLTYTTSPIVLTDAIEQLLKPLGRLHFPVHELAMMMSIALRFIPTLIVLPCGSRSQGLDDGLCLILGHPALRGQLGRRALHDPAAAGLIKADDPLALLDVAAGEQKACFIVHPALLVQHDGEIRRAQDAGGAVDIVEAVLGVLALAGVVHQQHADAPAVGKGLQPAHVVVVGIVGIFKGLCLGLDLG